MFFVVLIILRRFDFGLNTLLNPPSREERLFRTIPW
jgi:hypothetical protein